MTILTTETTTETITCFRHLSTEILFLRFLLDSWPQFFSELKLKSDLLAEYVSSSHLPTDIYVHAKIIVDKNSLKGLPKRNEFSWRDTTLKNICVEMVF